MATLYAVGVTGSVNWDGVTNRFATTSGGVATVAVTTTSDDVIFDANSGTGTATVSGLRDLRNLTCTGFAGTLLITTSSSNGLNVWGSFTLAAGMTYTQTSGGALTFRGNLSNTITTVGQTLGNVTFGFTGDTGTWTLQDALTTAGSAVITFNSGTFATGNFAVTCGSFSSSNTNTRTLTLGSSSITVTAATTPWSVTSTGLTLNAGTSTITLSGANAQFGGGASTTYYALVFNGSGAASLTTGPWTCTNLTRTGTAAKTDVLTHGTGSTITVTGTFTVNGNSTTNRVLVQSSALGSARTFSAAATSMSNVDFMDITGAGAASWNLSAITGGSGDAGGNSGITFTTPTTRYGVVAGNWSNTATWSTTSGGAGGASVPLPQDNVFLDANSGAGTYTTDMPRSCKDLDCTGFVRSFTLSTNTIFYGSVTFAVGMTFTTTTGWFLNGRSTHTLTTAGKTIPSTTLSVPSGTYTLQDALTCTGSSGVTTAGSFNTNNMAVTTTTFVSSGSATRSITLGTSTVSLTSTGATTVWNLTTTGLTLSAASSTIVISTASASTRTFSSGGSGFAYGTLSYTVGSSTGTLIITNSASYNTINFYGDARSLQIAGTQTVTNWNVYGLVGAVVLVRSTSVGTAATLNKTSGYLASDYVSVQDITGTGGATFYMGSRSTNVSGNTGLSFTDAPQRYAVGVTGTVTWDATTTAIWAVVSGGTGGLSVPSSATDVYLDSNSGTGILTNSGNPPCKNFVCTGFTGTLSIASSIGVNGTVVTLFSGMTVTGAGGFSIVSPSTTVVTSAGKTIGNFTVNGGTTSLADALTSTGTLTVTIGTFLTNNFAVTCNVFSSSNSNSRALTLGSSAITMTGTGTVLSMATITGLTVTANTAIWTLNGAASTMSLSGSFNANGGSLVMSGSGSIAVAGTWQNATRTGTAVKTDSLNISTGFTVVGTLALNGNSATNRLLVQSSGFGTARSVSAGAVSASNVDLMDITGAGAASWDLSAITGGSGDAGGNSGITFTTGQINYWVGGTGNWSDISHWANMSGGVGGTGRVPLPQGTARFDVNSFTGASQTVTNDMPRLAKDVDWTGVTNSPTWLNGSTTGAVYGSVTLIAAMAFTSGSSAVQLFGRGSHTITMAGLGWANSFSINGPGGTYTQQDAFRMGSTSTAFTVTAGTWITNGFSLTAGAIVSSGGFTRGIDLGISSVVLNGTGTVWSFTGVGGLNTVSAASASISITSTSATNRTFASGGATIGSLTYTAATAASLNLSISSFTIGTLNVFGSGKSLTMTAGITVTVTNWNVFGVAGSPVTLASFTPGTPANIVKAGGGEIGTDYLSITDINATPGSTWYAGTHSTDGGGNTGWIFTDPPITANASLSLVATGAVQAPVTATASLSLTAATATAKAPVTGTAAISLVATDTSVVVGRTGTAAISLVAATATAKATTTGAAQVTLTAVNTGVRAALAGSAVLTLTAARVVSVGARDVQVEFSLVYDKYVAGTPELYTMTTGTPSI